MSATISFIVIPTSTGTPTKKNWAWSPGARNTYSMAATIPVIAEIRGFLEDENQRSKVQDGPGEEEWNQSVGS